MAPYLTNISLVGHFPVCTPPSTINLIEVFKFNRPFSASRRGHSLQTALSTFDAPPSLRRAFNRVLEAYAGEDGVLAAHSRKLLNYMHNNLQVDTAAEGGQAQGVPTRALNTHRGPLSEAPRLFAEWLRPEAGVIKAIIEL